MVLIKTLFVELFINLYLFLTFKQHTTKSAYNITNF